MKPLEKVTKLLGSQKMIAKVLGISQQAVSDWRSNAIPGRHVIALEKATGGKITRYELRPDLYPRD